jgi:hypothetical protein
MPDSTFLKLFNPLTEPLAVRRMKRCAHCGGKLGLIIQRRFTLAFVQGPARGPMSITLKKSALPKFGTSPFYLAVVG